MPKRCYGHVAQLQIWGCKSSSRKFYLAHPCNEVDNTYTLFTLPGKVKHLVITVNLNGVDASMELDTGASLSTDWAAPIVPILKQDGNLSVCGD